MSGEGQKAIVLLSGGLDSTTCMAIARHEGARIYALSFRYGQRHSRELAAARRVAEAFGAVDHLVVSFDLGAIGGSALTDDALDVPKARDLGQIGSGVPVTYVPARNAIFLSFALAWAEVLDCRQIFIGVNARDYSGYPDCRPEFIEAFERLAQRATAMGSERGAAVRIRAPLLSLDKADIVRRGVELGVDFSLTFSCYDPDSSGEPCGCCDACSLRRKGFSEAGVDDPLDPAGQHR